jgi:hypothetical protein
LRETPDSLIIDLTDGRTIIVPPMWYPRLWYGTPEERNHFEIISDNTLIHWPDLDEDLSISGILAGRLAGESPESLEKMACPEERSVRGSFIRRTILSM